MQINSSSTLPLWAFRNAPVVVRMMQVLALLELIDTLLHLGSSQVLGASMPKLSSQELRRFYLGWTIALVIVLFWVIISWIRRPWAWGTQGGLLLLTFLEGPQRIGPFLLPAVTLVGFLLLWLWIQPSIRVWYGVRFLLPPTGNQQ
jgi:hypothetical protein